MRFALIVMLWILSAVFADAQTVRGDRFTLNTGPCTLRSGSGAPEGVVSGVVCDTYYQTNSPYDIYRKTSGSGTTGWEKLSATYPLTVPQGGTGQTTFGAGYVLVGNGTSAIASSANFVYNGTSININATPLNMTNSPIINAAAGIGPPTYTTRSVGTKTVWYPSVGAGAADYATGIEGNTLWWSVPLTAGQSFKWYAGTQVAMQLSTPGSLFLARDFNPFINYTSNIGALSTKFLTLHAAELWVETLVAQNTAATIGGRVLVGPTTTLTSDMTAAQAYIIVKHNQMAASHIFYMESSGKVEFMQVTGGPYAGEGCEGGQTGNFCYGITRNLDGSGANVWYAGDAAFNQGLTGSGHIDLYSVSGVRGVGLGPTIVGNVRTGMAYNNVEPRWAIGNLRGIYGNAGDVFGAAFGSQSGTSLKIDTVNGILAQNAGVTKFSIDLAGNAYFAGSGSFAGTISATAGSIGGWTINSENMYNACTGMYTGSAYGSQRFYSGSCDPSTAPFRVNSSGALVASNATLAGSLSAASGVVVIDSTGVAVATPATGSYSPLNSYKFTTAASGGQFGVFSSDNGPTHYVGLTASSNTQTQHYIDIYAHGRTFAAVDYNSYIQLWTDTASGFTQLWLSASNIVFNPNTYSFGTGVMQSTLTMAANIYLTGPYHIKQDAVDLADGNEVTHHTNGYYYEKASSERYKQIFERGWKPTQTQRETFLSIPAIMFSYNTFPDEKLLGFSAETFESLPLMVRRDKEGLVSNFRTDGFLAYTHIIQQDHEARIAALEKELATLKGKPQ